MKQSGRVSSQQFSELALFPFCVIEKVFQCSARVCQTERVQLKGFTSFLLDFVLQVFAKKIFDDVRASSRNHNLPPLF